MIDLRNEGTVDAASTSPFPVFPSRFHENRVRMSRDATGNNLKFLQLDNSRVRAAAEEFQKFISIPR